MKIPSHIEILIPDLDTIKVRGFYQSENSLKWVAIPGDIIGGKLDTLRGIVAELDEAQLKEGFTPLAIADFYTEASAETIESILRDDGHDPDDAFADEGDLNAHGVQVCAVAAVRRERAAQDRKWGRQEHDPGTWAIILSEESGEVSKAALNYKFGTNDPAALREFYKESVQVAAVGLAIAEDFERRFPFIVAEHMAELNDQPKP